MVNIRVDEIKDNVFKVSSRLNSTWGGNLVDMVRSQKYLELIKEEKLVKNAEVQGKRLLEGLEKIEKKMHDIIIAQVLFYIEGVNLRRFKIYAD
jgi:L-lysine 6-transaminase